MHYNWKTSTEELTSCALTYLHSSAIISFFHIWLDIYPDDFYSPPAFSDLCTLEGLTGQWVGLAAVVAKVRRQLGRKSTSYDQESVFNKLGSSGQFSLSLPPSIPPSLPSSLPLFLPLSNSLSLSLSLFLEAHFSFGCSVAEHWRTILFSLHPLHWRFCSLTHSWRQGDLSLPPPSFSLSFSLSLSPQYSSYRHKNIHVQCRYTFKCDSCLV